ncbi:MAG: YicC family protein [Ruminococcaceae bacterium]|nr:YicC family protein [Oscillospiraceae bacterium]
MVASMTGFGRDKQTIADYDITVEIKSVNHRYFEFSSRLPRAYQFLDERLKSFCHEKVSRGKVEVSVIVEDHSEDAVELQVNQQYADAYIKALHALAEQYELKDDITLRSFVGNNDIFVARRKEADEQLIVDAVLTVAAAAVDKFVEMRRIEGGRLKNDVNERCEKILERVSFVEERSPQTVKEYRERIEQKVRELIGDVQVDEQRLLTETAIFADKIAVAEETVRLRSHIRQLCTYLEGDEAIGRKLDFVVQEMNREANTIGSKAQDLEIAKAVVDIKSEIEKIREQIQNIE